MRIPYVMDNQQHRRTDPDVEIAWDAEFLRRLAEFDSGAANLIDWKELRRWIRTSMSRS